MLALININVWPSYLAGGSEDVTMLFHRSYRCSCDRRTARRAHDRAHEAFGAIECTYQSMVLLDEPGSVTSACSSCRIARRDNVSVDER